MKKKITDYQHYKAQLLKDPETRKEYEALGPEFRKIREKNFNYSGNGRTRTLESR